MSMMMCSSCDEMTDTDEDVEGVFEDATPFRYWCSSCADITFDGDPAILAAIKAQDLDRYDELKFEACTCTTPAVHQAMLEPPEPKSILNYECPIHGYDPDHQREKLAESRT